MIWNCLYSPHFLYWIIFIMHSCIIPGLPHCVQKLNISWLWFLISISSSLVAWLCISPELRLLRNFHVLGGFCGHTNFYVFKNLVNISFPSEVIHMRKLLTTMLRQLKVLSLFYWWTDQQMAHDSEKSPDTQAKVEWKKGRVCFMT